MRSFPGLDLTLDPLIPPKEGFVVVRVLQDHPAILTEYGPVNLQVQRKKNTKKRRNRKRERKVRKTGESHKKRDGNKERRREESLTFFRIFFSKKKNTTHFLPRTAVESLIKQGILEHVQ
jgi:hypothetical protein